MCLRHGLWCLAKLIILADSSTSSLLSTSSIDACQASQDAWNAASKSFYSSKAPGLSAGAYPTLTSFHEFFNTETSYSYALSGLATLSYGDDTETAQYAASTVKTIITTVAETNTEVNIGPSFDVPFPSCSVPYTKPTCSMDCSKCTLVAPNVQLIYFPVITASGNPSVTITPTGMPSGVFDGKTYTSGKAYFKYDNISAVNGCYSPVGSFYPGAVVTLHSDEISSLRNDGTYFDGAYSFNYADLNYPVPWNAWIGQFGCADEAPGCLPVETGAYNPYVSIPSEVKNLDPAWASCTMDPTFGSWDPPYALIPVQGILTASGPISTATAVPASTPASSQARNTVMSLSSESLGAMFPMNSKTVDPPAPSESSTTSTMISVRPSEDPPWTSSLQTMLVQSSSADPAVSPVIIASDTLVAGSQPVSSSADPVATSSVQTTLVQSSSIDPATSPVTVAWDPLVPSSQTISSSRDPLGPSSVQTTLLGIPSNDPAVSPVVITSDTLVPGSQTIVAGTTFSLLPTPSALVVNGSTAAMVIPTKYLTAPVVMTLGSTHFTQNADSGFVIGSQTLTRGGELTVSSTTYSLPWSPTAVFIDGSTVILSPASDPTTPPPVISVGSSVFRENSASEFVIESQTLTPGGQITVSDETISMGTSATDIEFDGTSTQGLGALIISGLRPFGGPNATSTTTGINFFTGVASRSGLGWWTCLTHTKMAIHLILVFVITIGF